MKRKFRVLSILSAVIMGATMCLTACNNSSEVAEHDHVWNSGEITTEPTCQTEGVKTYTCTVEGCTQKKTEPVGKNPHIWDGGSETKAPKCNEEGEKTYKCTNEGCTATKTEPIEKTKHSWARVGTVKLAPDFYTKGVMEYGCQNEGCTATKQESIPAGADFNYQFSEEDGGEWSYGSTAEFDGATGAFEFTPAEYDGESKAWKADGIEITKGAVNIPGGKTAVIRYTFTTEVPEKIEALADITFGGTGVTAHLVTPAAENNVEELTGGKFTSTEPIAVHQGDQFVLILKNGGEAAVAGGLSFTVEADCVHVWSDKGTVKTPAKCGAMGTTTYECINCGEKTDREDIPKLSHTIVSEITTRPTLAQEGTLHYECEVCHGEETKRDETLPKQENFAYDFEINNNGEFNGWQVGRVNYKFEDETFEFTKIQEHSAEAYTDNTNEQWKEIKNNWMAVNGMMGFAYKIPAGTPAKVNFRFELNAVADGEFTIRWAVKDKDGAVKNEGGKPKFVNGDSRSSYYFVEHIDVAENDILYVLVNHEDKGDQCTFNLALTPYVEFAGANFHDDFERNDQGVFKGWQVGTVNYHFPENDPEHPETFDFTKITAANNGGDGYFDNTNGWKEIKNNFMAVNGMMGFAYAFENDYSGSFSLHLERALSDGNFSVRMAVKDSKGNIKTNGGKAIWLGEVKDNNSFDINKAISVYGGDTLYILVNHDDGKGDQCTFTLTIATNGVQQQPSTSTVVSDFHDDFHDNTVTESNWEYGSADYGWDGAHSIKANKDNTESFTYTKSETYDSANNAWTADGVEIKADWIKFEKNAVILYKAPAGGEADFHITFKGEENKNTWSAVRIIITDGNNNFKDREEIWDGKNNSQYDKTFSKTLAAGDKVYFIFFSEGTNGSGVATDNNYGHITLTVSLKTTQQPGASFEGANFHDDFHDNTVTESNWEYGSADYGWDGNHSIKANAENGESFDYIKSETYDSANSAWTAEGVEIKADWIKFEKNAVILYKAPAGGEADFHITFKGEDGKNTWSAVRIIITDGNNNFKGREEIWDGKNASQYDKTFSKTLAAGDKVYFIFFSEGTNGSGVATDNKYGHLTLTVTYKAA